MKKTSMKSLRTLFCFNRSLTFSHESPHVSSLFVRKDGMSDLSSNLLSFAEQVIVQKIIMGTGTKHKTTQRVSNDKCRYYR